MQRAKWCITTPIFIQTSSLVACVRCCSQLGVKACITWVVFLVTNTPWPLPGILSVSLCPDVGTDCYSRTPAPNSHWRQKGNNLTQALNFSSCQWELHLFVQESGWNSHLALFETLSIPLVLAMDLKDVPHFSGRLWLEYHFNSSRQKIEERIESEGKKENSQPGNKGRWKIKNRNFWKTWKERRVLGEDKERECRIEDKNEKEEERGEWWRGRKKRKTQGMKVRRENVGEADMMGSTSRNLECSGEGV